MIFMIIFSQCRKTDEDDGRPQGNTNILLIYWTTVHITLVAAISKSGKNNKWTASI